jgi:hypothetical protein
MKIIIKLCAIISLGISVLLFTLSITDEIDSTMVYLYYFLVFTLLIQIIKRNKYENN